MKRRGLGRGLDALLGDGSAIDEEFAPSRDGELRQIPVDLLRRSRFQPRREIGPEALEELAQSIRARGVVQPIVVRPAEDGTHYEIIAGERRWRAAQLAELNDIPALVREVPDDAAYAIALIENIQREDLNPVEEAMALRRLIDECDLTHQQVADAVGRSRAAVSNLLRLLELNNDVREMLERGELEMGHARALLGLTGDDQSQAALEVVSKELSARQTESLVRRLKNPAGPAQLYDSRLDPDVRELTQRLSEQLGARVAIQHAKSGKGRLVIHYTTLDELDGILDHIK